MKQETLKLFLENYENKGICANLPNFVKSYEKKFKTGEKTISYYPWAVIEKLFRMQGGKIEVADFGYAVKFEGKQITLDNTTGEYKEENAEKEALFIHLKGFWQGEELEEFYPIFDNQNAQVIKTPNAMQLNTARQRGMVRLIARLSGIGLHIFEQQTDPEDDSLFDISITSKEEKVKKAETKLDKAFEEKIEIKKPAKVVKKEEEPTDIFELDAPKKATKIEKVEKKKEEKSYMEEFLMGQALEITPKETELKEEPQGENFAKDSEEYAEKMITLKSLFKTPESRMEVKQFILGKKKQMLGELDYQELCELEKILK